MPVIPMINAETARTLAASLSTWRTVDRRHVHKAAVAEVLVTDLVAIAPDRYAVTVQWPRWHPFFRPRADGPPHPLLFVESLRQAGIYLTHRALDIPLGRHFVFQSIGARYASAEDSRLPPGPSVVVLVVQVHRHRRGIRPVGARLEIEAWSGSTRIATATATYRCLSSAAYARVRAQGLATATDQPPPPATTPPPDEEGGRDHGRQTLVQVDLANPTFFDHAVDHLPGMLLMDSALSAAGLRSPENWPRLRDFELRAC